MKELVSDIHKIGMKVMLWYSIPYIGIYSENFKKYETVLLKYSMDRKYAVLDPRYKEVRDFLVSTYINAVTEWDLDGLKLDFIDAFILETKESMEYDERRDIESLEDAIDALLSKAIKELRNIKPDILIEFRQSYVGPFIRKYGNMLRVTDCPANALRNRTDMINLRLTSGKTAVHSDMIMWNNDDSNEAVAIQLLSTLYAVPQIYVRVDKLSNEHLAVLKHYLSFWKNHRDVLLDGEFKAFDPDCCYSQASASNEETEIISVYSNNMVTLSEKESIIFNISSTENICLKNAQNSSCQVKNCTGNVIFEGNIPDNIFMVTVPIGGMVEVKK